MPQRVDAVRFIVVTLETYERCEAGAPDCVYLIEEGSLQRLFMLLVEDDGVRGDHDLRTYLTRAPFGDALVHVKVSADVALGRLEDRERGLSPRLAGLPAVDARQRLIDGGALLARAASEVVATRSAHADSGPWLVDYDSAGGPQSASTNAEAVAELLARARSTTRDR